MYPSADAIGSVLCEVFPNAILNLPREFARLFRREEFLAARNAPVHPRIFDCYQHLVVACLKSLANLLHALRIANCAGNFHNFAQGPCGCPTRRFLRVGFLTLQFTSIAPHRPSLLPRAAFYPALPAATPLVAPVPGTPRHKPSTESFARSQTTHPQESASCPCRVCLQMSAESDR